MSRARKAFSIVGTIALIAAVAASAASAVVLKRHGAHRASIAPVAGVDATSLPNSLAGRGSSGVRRFDTGGNVSYNGGPVVHGLSTYAFYWDPAGHISAGSRALIDQYFTDVAHDSGTNGNNYSVLQQYTDTSGQDIQYSQAFAGELVDTNPFPASSVTCTHNGSTLPGYNTAAAHCLFDSQLTAELGSYVSSHGLPTGLNTQYYIFTPPEVIGCFDGAPPLQCSDNTFCAYHSFVGSSSSPLLYAFDPFTFEYDPAAHANQMKGCQSDGNAAVQEPNSDVADVVLKAVGHESRETLSDPLLSAWFDANGNELDDKCNAKGTTLGHDPNAFLPVSGTSPALFTQTYNAHNYYMQSEWSNGANGGAGACAMAPGPGTVTPAFTAPGPQAAGTTFAFSGAGSTSTNPIASASWNFGDGTAGTGGTPTHSYSTPGTYHVTLRLTDTLGNAATVTHDVSVFTDTFTFGKAKLNKKKGTAKLPVTVPGAGTVTMSGKGIAPIHKATARGKTVAAGTTKLKVKAKGKAAKTLKKKGKVTVKPKVTYTPTGATPVSQKKKIKLVRKR